MIRVSSDMHLEHGFLAPWAHLCSASLKDNVTFIYKQNEILSHSR